MRAIYQFLKNIYYWLEKKKKEKYMESLINNGLKIGENTLILDNVFFDPAHCFLISVGDNCIISDNIRLIAHDASTKNHLGYTKIGFITIEDNCFIGPNSIVLAGVTIGANSIVGAGSIVTKDVPPSTVVAGNPARRISSLEEYLEKVKSISKDKKIFDENYLIGNLDEAKRKEMMESIGDSIGFIV